MIFLPRQARDEHRENSKKGPFSSQHATQRRTSPRFRPHMQAWCVTPNDVSRATLVLVCEKWSFVKTGSGQTRGAIQVN